MTYDYYLKPPMPMCEIKLNQLLYKTPQFTNSLNKFIIYPFIQEYADISAGEIYIIKYSSFYAESLLWLFLQFIKPFSYLTKPSFSIAILSSILLCSTNNTF